MCSLDGRSGTNTGAIPRGRSERAWKDGIGDLVVLLLAERAPSEGWEGNSQTILIAR
jgi:hypothetical protein